MKQTIAFITLCAVLFCCQSPKPKLMPTTIVIRDTVYVDSTELKFIHVIGQIESGNTDSISAENGAGIGRYGIYNICLHGTGLDSLLRYKHSDMMKREASERVFWAMMGIFVYQHMQRTGNAPTWEELSRKWAGGPNGDLKKATEKYLRKYRELYDK